MKWALMAGCFLAAVAVQSYVYWVRRRAHSMTQGTQLVIRFGPLVELALIGAALLIWLLM